MGRAPCCDKTSVKRGPWSLEEDSKLKDYIEKHGTGGNWIALPHKAGLNRCGKSCRLRWLNYLRPNIKHGDFSDEEDRIICSLYLNIGSRWSIIAAQLPGRTDNDIKNYWNTKLKKKLMGLFPPITTHHHRKLPFPSSSSSLHDQNPPTSPSSIIYTDYYGHSTNSFTSLEPVSLPYANTCCTTTSLVSLPPFYQNQEAVSLSLPMQYNNYSMRDNMVMFGSEGSCSSSSDGSFKEIKQEEMGYHHNYVSTGFDDYYNNNFMLSCCNNINGEGGENSSISQYAEKSGGVGYTDQTLSPLDYSFEDIINQLISSTNSSNVDENKREEKPMYCYYYL